MQIEKVANYVKNKNDNLPEYKIGGFQKLVQSALPENIDLKTIISPKIPLIGNSQFISKIKKQITFLSNSNARLLISGEYGTGKKLISKIIHKASKYKDKFPITIDFKSISIQNIDNLLTNDLSNLNDR